jgi:DNA-binding transcriptional LysR family regulator
VLIDQINLNELRIFLSVFENLSMTRAAEQINLTQSGVSQHIKHLEDVLQARLFDRINKKLVPTAAATQLFEACRENLLQIENALAHLQEGQKKLIGKICVGMPIEFGNNLVMPLLARFCRENPAVNLHIRMGFASEMNSSLLDGNLDFAFVDTFHLDRRIETQKVFDEILYLCCSPAYLRDKKVPKSLQDFEALDFIEYQKGNPMLNMWFEQRFAANPHKLKVRAYVMDVQGVAKLIKNDLGCGVLPAYLVEALRDRGIELCVFDEAKEKVHNIISIAYLKDKTWLPASLALKNYLLKNLTGFKTAEPQPLLSNGHAKAFASSAPATALPS